MGPLVETFVASELLKAISASDVGVGLFHLRTADQREIDFILEGPHDRIVAIEVEGLDGPTGRRTPWPAVVTGPAR